MPEETFKVEMKKPAHKLVRKPKKITIKKDSEGYYSPANNPSPTKNLEK